MGCVVVICKAAIAIVVFIKQKIIIINELTNIHEKPHTLAFVDILQS